MFRLHGRMLFAKSVHSTSLPKSRYIDEWSPAVIVARDVAAPPVCLPVAAHDDAQSKNGTSRLVGVITPNQIPSTTIVTYFQKRLQKQNFKPLSHYTCMQCTTSHLQTVQQNILSHIILETYRKFTVATLRLTQNVSCNIYTHPIYQQVANVTV